MTAPRIDVVVYAHDMASVSYTALRELLADAGYNLGYLSVRNVHHYAEEYDEMVIDHR